MLLENLPERQANKPRNSHGKIDFAKLAQTIAAKWKKIDKEELAYFQDLSQKDRERYQREMKVWKELEKAENASRSPEPAATEAAAAAPQQQPQPQAMSDDVDDEPIPYTPEEPTPFPAMANLPRATTTGNTSNDNVMMMNFMNALEPTPLQEDRYTPSAVTTPRPIPPTLSHQYGNLSLHQLQRQQRLPFPNLFGEADYNMNLPWENNNYNLMNRNENLQRLAQSLGSDGVATLIRAFRP